MVPNNLVSWIFLVAACVIGFLIGQWIRNRRDKDRAESDIVNRMENVHQKKRLSKKERLKARRLLK